ncbi:hypothetical protein BKI52_31045 [marine bacterium AO1-C]|nr:hypothetical protein BKI52_31045 [marine bacterium AO1-C]
MQIELYSKRTIYLKKFYQWSNGVLEGYPNEYLNRRYIAHALETAEKMHPKPHLFTPQEIPLNVKLPSFLGKAVEIPGIACVAYFRSSGLRKDDDAPLYESYCSMVWFQEAYGLPIDQEILEKIKTLEWESVATEYEI